MGEKLEKTNQNKHGITKDPANKLIKI